MDETTFKILDALAKNLGMPLSINGLTEEIKKFHKTAYYKNIYDRTKRLEREGVVKIRTSGKNSLIELDFSRYLLMDMLTEMELLKKRKILRKNPELGVIFQDMESFFSRGFLISSASVIGPENTIPLNRMEFLIILREPADSRDMLRKTVLSIHLTMQSLQKHHNIKMDSLIVTERGFLNMPGKEESNPLKEMLLRQTAFHLPQNYWSLLKTATISEGIKQWETNPAKISEQDISYNLNRFGYREMGSKIREGRKICLEYIITSILISGDARRMEAIPVMLAKNRTDYNALIFLCGKYGKLGKLLGMLRAMNRVKKNGEAENAIKLLEALKTREEKINADIKEKMRLYNAY